MAVRIQDRTIADVTQMPVRDLHTWLDTLSLSPSETQIAEAVLREARSRTRFLSDVGLTYLTLDRATRTLSGGEAQRITLSNALGAALVDATYVLDEPSIGLHPRDLDKLLALLMRLRDHGNTVIMVEHDLEAMRIADYMVELGPHAGERGGEVVFAGPIAEGPFTIEARPSRTNRSTQHWSLELVQNGEVATTASAVARATHPTVRLASPSARRTSSKKATWPGRP